MIAPIVPMLVRFVVIPIVGAGIGWLGVKYGVNVDKDQAAQTSELVAALIGGMGGYFAQKIVKKKPAKK